MKVRIYDKNNKAYVYNLSEMNFEQVQSLFRKWYYGDFKKDRIECLCIEHQKLYPKLHLRKRNNIGLVNNRKNYQAMHDPSCEFNTRYRERLKEHGVVIDDGYIKVDQLSKETSRLSTLFSVMLEQAGINRYDPDEVRNISTRILSAASKVIIEGLQMIKGNVFRIFVAKEIVTKSGKVKPLWLNHNPKNNGHNLVIGWGKIKKNPIVIRDGNKPEKIKISLYSLDNTDKHIADIEVLKRVYDKDVIYFDGCEAGYWLIWRTQHKKYDYIFEDKKIIFMPAEENTRIPIDNIYEANAIKHLVSQGKTFKKPILKEDLKNGHRPDFIIYDDFPFTILEIVGLSDGYRNYQTKRRKYYNTINYKYRQWNPLKESIEEIRW